MGLEQGRLARKLDQLARFDVVIVDELGYVPFDKAGADLLFGFISRRYCRGARSRAAETAPRAAPGNSCSRRRCSVRRRPAADSRLMPLDFALSLIVYELLIFATCPHSFEAISALASSLRAREPRRHNQSAVRPLVRGVPGCDRPRGRHRPYRAPCHRADDQRGQLPPQGRPTEPDGPRSTEENALMGTRRDVASRRSAPSGHVATTTLQRGPFSRCHKVPFLLAISNASRCHRLVTLPRRSRSRPRP